MIGERFKEFDFHIVLSHFKGHGGTGFGGAIKNVSMGYTSIAGKVYVHATGRPVANINEAWRAANPLYFKESMAEATKAIVDTVDGRILYINVLNAMSVDCDCVANPRPPTMADIGILASLDPVALDQASVNMIFAAEDGQDLQATIRRNRGEHALEYAEQIGLGTRSYVLVNLDD
jgi:uncharacterized Fe-S center protein